MKNVLIKIIEFYQKNRMFYFRNIKCKFYPTCSEYTKQAIQKYGAVKGIWLRFKRFLRCNPFSKGGYDPLK